MAGIIITFLAAFLGLCFLWLFSLPVERTSKGDATLQQTHLSVPGLSAMFSPISRFSSEEMITISFPPRRR